MLGRLAILTTMLVICGAARNADACSPPAPGISYRDVVPSTISAPPPTNVLIEIGYGGDPGDVIYEAQLRPVGGLPVETQVSRRRNRVLLRPAAPLEPLTAYEVLDRVIVPCVGYGPCDAAAHSVVGTFTTGAGQDTTPPTFAGLTGMQVLPLETCDDSACCGPYTAVRFGLQFDGATDDGDHIRFEIYLDRAGEQTQLVGTWGYLICSSGGMGVKPRGDFMALAGDRFLMRAFDIAGNEDTNDSQLTLADYCDPAVRDAGPSSDATTPVDDDPGAGCGCRTSSAGSSTAPMLLVIPLLRRRRRPS